MRAPSSLTFERWTSATPIFPFLVVLAFLSTTTTFAQQSDFGLWKGIGLERDITEALSFSLDDQVRLENNANQFKSTFTDLGLTYKYKYEMKYSLGYRFVLGTGKTKHRFYTDFGYKYKAKKIQADFSLRFRSLIETVPQDRNARPDNYFRTKITVKHQKEFYQFTPFASAEIFYHLNKKIRKVDKFRIGLGAEYDLPGRNTLKLAYLFFKEYNVKNRLKSSILYLTLSVDITPKE